MVGVLFQHLLPNLKSGAVSSVKAGVTDWQERGVLRQFSQSELLDTNVFENDAGLADYGFVYYPYRCVNGAVANCKVHMTLHGCGGSTTGAFGELNIQHTGWVQYAAANDLIVIFPQIRYQLTNPYTCFDFIGYTSWFTDEYMTRNGR